MASKFMRLAINRREDAKGFHLYIGGDTFMSFNYWRIWRCQKRALFGFLFTIKLPSKVARGSAHWQSWPAWRRWIHPFNWMTRTAYIGWRTRGGKGPCHGPWPKLRMGFNYFNNVPYSFR